MKKDFLWNIEVDITWEYRGYPPNDKPISGPIVNIVQGDWAKDQEHVQRNAVVAQCRCNQGKREYPEYRRKKHKRK